MGKNRKNKIFNSISNLRRLRREEEIKRYGKIVSLRPSKVFKSKKNYSRKSLKIDLNED